MRFLSLKCWLFLTADVELKVERPIKINMSSDRIQQCLNFSTYFSPCVDRITEITSTLSGTADKEGRF